tara:strand:- start:316 stop:948 length:633 start_codon:yes stop_codon:yes gene_type:complete
MFIKQPEKCVNSVRECGLYGYGNNNPIKFIDPTGMKFIVAGTPKFQAYVAEITQNHAKVNPGGAWSTIDRSVHNKVNLKNWFDLSRDQRKSSPSGQFYDPKSNTIYLKPYRGVMSNGKISSPATVAEHEAGHALEKDQSPVINFLRKAIPSKNWTNQAEKFVIEKYEHPAAENAGEAKRNSHFGVEVYTKGVTSNERTPKGVIPSTLEVE